MSCDCEIRCFAGPRAAQASPSAQSEGLICCGGIRSQSSERPLYSYRLPELGHDPSHGLTDNVSGSRGEGRVQLKVLDAVSVSVGSKYRFEDQVGEKKLTNFEG